MPYEPQVWPCVVPPSLSQKLHLYADKFLNWTPEFANYLVLYVLFYIDYYGKLNSDHHGFV